MRSRLTAGGSAIVLALAAFVALPGAASADEPVVTATVVTATDVTATDDTATDDTATDDTIT